MLPFFGLTPEHRANIFIEIDEIITYGKGYSWSEVYNFPLWLRRFTYRRILERQEAQKEALEKQNNTITPNTPKSRLHKPNIETPTYKSRAPK